jgi:hypothetical protein
MANMDIADDCIREIRNWFQQKESTGKARRFGLTEPVLAERSTSVDHKTKAGPPRIIFKEDTRVELGHPSAGSCSAILATPVPSLVDDGRVTLVGPDVDETDLDTLPFAQIVVASCEGNIEDACASMDRVLHAAAQTDGYMLRSVPNQIWARVSKDGVKAGFSLRQLGFSLLQALRNECPDIKSSEIFFATSSKDDISALNAIVEPTRAKLRKLQAFGRKEDGTYECDTSLDCTECPEKPVCDTIRDVITIRKGDRIITIGGDGDDRKEKSRPPSPAPGRKDEVSKP